jgi:hypothetical protein
MMMMKAKKCGRAKNGSISDRHNGINYRQSKSSQSGSILYLKVITWIQHSKVYSKGRLTIKQRTQLSMSQDSAWTWQKGKGCIQDCCFITQRKEAFSRHPRKADKAQSPWEIKSRLDGSMLQKLDQLMLRVNTVSMT